MLHLLPSILQYWKGNPDWTDPTCVEHSFNPRVSLILFLHTNPTRTTTRAYLDNLWTSKGVQLATLM